MQLFQTFVQLKNNPNSWQIAQTMFGGNPLFSQATQMMQGKDIDSRRIIIQNVAKEKNISPQELQQWAPQFGISL